MIWQHWSSSSLVLVFLWLSTNGPFIGAAPRADDFRFVILHNNDMHARFEETERNSGTCQKAHLNTSCMGGFARTAHVIRQFRKKAQDGTSPPVVYLNAGDTFVGTAWFSLFTWNISSAFINKLKPDAMSLGNHEFDLTHETLTPFVNAVQTPIVAANLDFSKVPSLNSTIKRSVVLNVSGRKVGVIGYLTPETIKISSPGKVAFEDEVPAVTREAQLLNSQGVNIIIALGHSGYEMDKQIAEKVALVDVVIGGHTNTFLWNGPRPDFEAVEDPYPKIVTQPSGKTVPVVQAYAYTKYLGLLNVTFNANGDLTSFAGQPILLDSSIPQDEDVLKLLDVYRPAIDALNTEIIGKSKVVLDGNSNTCRHQECNLGNLITDALVAYVTWLSSKQWTDIPIGIYNGGGIRNSITPDPSTGEVTRGDMIGVLPFGNQVVAMTLTGADLLMTMEQMVRGNGKTSYGEFPQVSGLQLEVDMSKRPFNRVVSLKARCGLCDIPVYEQVDPKENYTIVTSNFLANGGDGVTTFPEKGMNKKIQELGDLDIVVWYFKKYSPVYPEVSGRIKVAQGVDASSSGHKAMVMAKLIWILIGVILTNLLT